MSFVFSCCVVLRLVVLVSRWVRILWTIVRLVSSWMMVGWSMDRLDFGSVFRLIGGTLDCFVLVGRSVGWCVCRLVGRLVWCLLLWWIGRSLGRRIV
jgi:hypothetical protein